MSINFNFNTFHSDSWSVTFSNMPSLSGISDMSMFDNFVKGLVIPEYNIEEIESSFQIFKVRHPVAPRANYNLNQISIDFKVTEDLLNYFTIFEYMRHLKYGELNKDYTDELIRKYVIKSIILHIMDNQKREVAFLRFTNAFILSLSSLTLTTGTADELTFTITCSYEELFYERKNIYIC